MYEDNFGEWMFKNIMSVESMAISIFSNNPRISGLLNFNETFAVPTSSLQCFAGILFYCLQKKKHFFCVN